MLLYTLIRHATNAVLAAAVLAFVVLGLGPHTGLYRTVTILSDSMSPEFDRGDVVISTPADPADIRTGDVISFHAPVDGAPVVTHRVVEVVRGGGNPIVRTRGDANVAIDPWDAALGTAPVWRQRASVPMAGTVVRGLRDPWLRTMSVYAIPFGLACFMIVGIWRPRRPRDEWDDVLDDEYDYRLA